MDERVELIVFCGGDGTARIVDTGSEELDRQLSGYLSVVCGYPMAQRKEVRRG